MNGNVKDHHRFLLGEHLTQIRHLEQAIDRVTAEITRRFTPPSPPEETTAPEMGEGALLELSSDSVSQQGRSPCSQVALSWAQAVVLLCSIPGIGERTAIGIEAGNRD